MCEILLFMLVISILANWQAVETIHHSDIFATLRAYAETRGGFWYDMIACPYCLSHWTAFVFTTLSFVLACRTQGAQLEWWLAWCAFSLAVTRGSNVLNDLTRPWCRTPHGMDDTKVLPIIIEELEKTHKRP